MFIVQVIPDYKLKTKPLGVFDEVPIARRQYVERVGVKGVNLYQIKYDEVYPNNVLNFILESKSIEVPNSCATIEDGAWQNLSTRSQKNGSTSSKQPVYAIHIRNTLFDESEPWNMNNFGIEHSIIQNPALNKEDDMDGIQNAYINIGMLFTWFCIHCEDCDLASVNYLHSGATKHWICVPRSEKSKFERALMSNIAVQYECQTVYRHKCFIVDEGFLIKHGIKYSKVVQYAGEFVITLYGAYHWGWNSGFNVCEAMNLASPKFKKIYEETVLCASTCKHSSNAANVYQRIGQLL